MAEVIIRLTLIAIPFTLAWLLWKYRPKPDRVDSPRMRALRARYEWEMRERVTRLRQ